MRDKPFEKGAYKRWLQRLRSGALGERETNHQTWVLDDLWREACREYAKEHDRL